MSWPIGQPRIFSEEHKRKISIAMTGKVYSDERRAAISDRQRGTTRAYSDEALQKLIARNKAGAGRRMSAEAKEKMSRAARGRSKSEAHRAAIAAAKTGKPAPWNRGRSPAWPVQRLYYCGAPLRSSYELRVAKAFDALGIAWQFEPKRFDLGTRTYLPDFYLPDERMYVEVKGWYGPYAATTCSLFFERYPDEQLAILQLPQIVELERAAAKC